MRLIITNKPFLLLSPRVIILPRAFRFSIFAHVFFLHLTMLKNHYLRASFLNTFLTFPQTYPSSSVEYLTVTSDQGFLISTVQLRNMSFLLVSESRRSLYHGFLFHISRYLHLRSF